ncbi:MAG: hypothetical protein ACYTGZ_16450 [Planctomycetota bacterium]|jgi:hypothetical protein
MGVRWLLVFSIAVVGLLLLLCTEGSPVRARISRDAVEGGAPLASRGAETAPATGFSGGGAQQPERVEEKVEEEEEILETPDDPVERGDRSLFISLTSQETGKPVASTVRLYRLGAPGNEHWTEGDQLQATRNVPVEGLDIHNLPAGRYRIHAEAQRHPSDDPFLFSVRAPTTRVAFALPMPRQFRARLKVYDEHGNLLRKSRYRRGSYNSSSRTVKIPWLRKRKLRNPDLYSIGIGGGVGGASGGRSDRTVEADERGFDLGTFWENPRYERRWRRSRWRFVDRTEVRARPQREPGRDHTYMALSVDPAPIRDSVLLPDGRLADITAARFWIHGEAVLAPANARADFWRTLKVKVKVTYDGYENLEFEVGAGETIPVRTLKARASSAPK